MPRIPAAAALALVMTGCSVQPRVVAQTPAMVVVESRPNVEAATATAQRYCQTLSRNAVLRETRTVTAYALHYSYECVSPEPPPAPAPPPARG